MTAPSKEILENSRKYLRRLVERRNRINYEVEIEAGRLKAMIGLLGNVDEMMAELAEMERILGPRGMTDAVRAVVLSDDNRAWSAVEVRDRLRETKVVDLSKYSNVVATIHTVLKRLSRGGEIEKSQDGYRRKRSPNNATVAPLRRVTAEESGNQRRRGGSQTSVTKVSR